jgi:hypothetical protein
MSSQRLIHRTAWLGALSCLLDLWSPVTTAAGEVPNIPFAGYRSVRDFGVAATLSTLVNGLPVEQPPITVSLRVTSP